MAYFNISTYNRLEFGIFEEKGFGFRGLVELGELGDGEIIGEMVDRVFRSRRGWIEEWKDWGKGLGSAVVRAFCAVRLWSMELGGRCGYVVGVLEAGIIQSRVARGRTSLRTVCGFLRVTAFTFGCQSERKWVGTSLSTEFLLF